MAETTDQEQKPAESKKKVKKRRSRQPIEPWKRILMGSYLLAMAVALTIMLVGFWPQSIPDNHKSVSTHFLDDPACSEFVLILVVLVAGALGSFIHAATSFATFAGNRTLQESWMWWYLLRPFIGAALAVIFYFVFRGGFDALEGQIEYTNPYSLAAMAGLVGMFSKQATDKLSDIFANLFQTKKGDEERTDKLTEKLAKPVSEAMLKLHEMTTLVIPEGKTEANILLGDLLSKLDPPVTRIPVLDSKNVLRYIIHQSMLYKFVAEKSIEASKTRQEITVAELTLEELAKAPGMKEMLAEAVTFVALEETVGEARQKMDRKKGCQDVFVTATGEPSEPVLGWLTNVDIAKHLEG